MKRTMSFMLIIAMVSKPVIEKLIQNPNVTSEILSIMTAELERPKHPIIPLNLLDRAEERLSELQIQQRTEDDSER